MEKSNLQNHSHAGNRTRAAAVRKKATFNIQPNLHRALGLVRKAHEQRLIDMFSVH